MQNREMSNDKVTVVTMTEERRSVLVVPRGGPGSVIRVCPEPPADAAQNFSSLFNAGASAASGDAGAKGEVKLSNSASAVLASAFFRSQGIQFFRDGATALCMAWLNDIYNQGDLEGWRNDFKLLLNLSYKLIEHEIPAISAQAKQTGMGEKAQASSPNATENQ